MLPPTLPPGFAPPGILIAPPLPGVKPPPCDKEHDKDCKPPPHEVPEPGTLMILLAAALALGFGWILQRREKAKIEAKR
ncbi:MAG TPA: PEP-CTERM sorting domain-containing protein [Parvularculaceae bacterium]|nr:PEP-CTERM sorting domain-containing protein [Parvularculaceae bacterium]